MNYYTKLIACAAAKFTGRPAVLSPLLDSYCGWASKKSRFSSIPPKQSFIMLLEIKEKQDEDSKKKFKENEGRMKVGLDCCSRKLWVKKVNNFNWSRDCMYEYATSPTIAPLVRYLALFWLDNEVDALGRVDVNLEDSSAQESKVEYQDNLEFRLIPTEVIGGLDPFLKRVLNKIIKKSEEANIYVLAETEVPEFDVLSPLNCIPVCKILEMEFQDMDAKAAVGRSSQEDSSAKTSQTDSKAPKSKSAEPKETVTTKPKLGV